MGCDHCNIYRDERGNPDMGFVLILCDLSLLGFYGFFLIVLHFLTQLTYNASVLFLQLVCVLSVKQALCNEVSLK